jgi:thioredoxin reductase
MHHFRIAIVGAGPAGFYAAEALQRLQPGIGIDMLERLDRPHGLVRWGVAPDHIGTKAVARVFDRIASRPGFKLRTGICLGVDASYESLKAEYSAVILAFGAEQDRELGIPGESLRGVYRSGAVARWANAHPDFLRLAPRFGRRVAVIGMGNVALDMARILAKTASELGEGGHIAIANAGIEEIHVIGRRGAAAHRFTNPELAELGKLARAVPLVDQADLTGDIALTETWAGFTGRVSEEKPVGIRFHFNRAPVAVLGQDRVTGLELDGETLAVDSVITAIGYRCAAVPGVPMAGGRVLNQDGRVEPRVWVVGWARRGPSGTIPTNRADAAEVAKRALAELAASQ